jgi:quinol monooxygenase YgiN
MIKHIVIWKLKNSSTPLNKNEDGLAIQSALENLKGKIPGLLHIEVGYDCSNHETAGDIVLYSEFVDKAALTNYLKHPAHVAVGKIVRPRTCARRMIDYECS